MSLVIEDRGIALVLISGSVNPVGFRGGENHISKERESVREVISNAKDENGSMLFYYLWL